MSDTKTAPRPGRAGPPKAGDSPSKATRKRVPLLIGLGLIALVVIAFAIYRLVDFGSVGEPGTDAGDQAADTTELSDDSGDETAGANADGRLDRTDLAGESDASFSDSGARPGADDTMAELGESIAVAGLTIRVDAVEAVDIATGDGLIRAAVALTNTTDEPIDFGLFDWVVQLSDGSFVHPEGLINAELLGSGTIDADGTVEGDVYFDVGADANELSVIYEPSVDSTKRAVWPVDIG